MAQASKPDSSNAFEFKKVAFLVEVLPYRAASLAQLLTGVTLAPDVSIFYHLHQRFFLEPDRLPEFPNDFSAWANESLGDAVVAERLANLSLSRSLDLAIVRREISVILAEHLERNGNPHHVRPGLEFIFLQPRMVGFGSGRRAETSQQFAKILKTIDSDSIGYHLFTPKAAPSQAVNDFAIWFKAQGYESLAQQLDAFDPYLNSLEDNRAYVLELIEAGLGGSSI
jgi:hypothetical protein